MSQWLWNRLKQWALPAGDCLLCMERVDFAPNKALIICTNCHHRLKILKHACDICALPLPTQNDLLTSSPLKSCGACLKSTPPYTKTVSAFHYEPPISDFITHLKFNGQQQLIPILCDYLRNTIQTQYLKDELPAQLIPVPLHKNRLKQRGFNQAQRISQRLSSALKIETNINSVIRVRPTLPQTSLNANARQRNLQGCFQVNGALAKHVAIVDDVMTTGATAKELTHQLLLSGCSRVDVWTVARAHSQTT